MSASLCRVVFAENPERHAFRRKCSIFEFPLHNVLLLNSCPPYMELLNVNPIFNVSLNESCC